LNAKNKGWGGGGWYDTKTELLAALIRGINYRHMLVDLFFFLIYLFRVWIAMYITTLSHTSAYLSLSVSRLCFSKFIAIISALKSNQLFNKPQFFTQNFSLFTA
jgi:hypothetical protein